MFQNFQRTLKKSTRFCGVGVHTGALVHIELRPAPQNTGIVFQRTDLPGKPYIKASPHCVFDTSLATRIGNPSVYVSTIEHLMAAFFGFGIDNAYVSIDNCEVPILDGSAAPFLVLINDAGVQELPAPRKIIFVQQPIEVVDERDPKRFIRVEPSKTPRISYAIDFSKAKTIGKQSISFDYNPKTFCEEFSYARTFCLQEEIDFLRSQGLARGGSLESALVVSSSSGLLNTNGLRHHEEFVRHKVLDCVGDLHLIGKPILGHIIANKAGHDLHVKLAKAIVDAPAAICKVADPSSLEFAISAVLRDLVSYPKSLLDVKKTLTGLPVG